MSKTHNRRENADFDALKKRCSTKSSVHDPTLKTRHFVDVVTEITRSMEIHKEKKTILGGVHLELTGEVNDDGYSVVCPPF